MKIAVVGLGNSVLTDDSAGIRISELLEQNLQSNSLPANAEVSVFQNEAGGWDILDVAVGFDVLILVDAVLDTSLKPGELRWYADEVFSSLRLSGVHSMDVFSALNLAKQLSMKVPDQIYVLGVGVKDTLTLSEACTPEVVPAIEKGAVLVSDKIHEIASAK